MSNPSRLAIVPFVSVDNMMKLVLATGIERFLTELAAYIEDDFRRWEKFDKTPRVASHSHDGVIELMPTSDGQMYGFKYVNGHPKNARDGKQTVTAFGMLADVGSGYPMLLTEMTILTALRTAATSALAAKHLARKDAGTMAVIGNGAQASSPTASGDSLALGTTTVASGQDSMAIGAQTTASGNNSIVIGNNFSKASADGAIALGVGTTASAAGAVAIGNGSVADIANTVSVGSAGNQRRIVNVAAGIDNTDAVNVSQLKGVTDLIGGGVSVDPTTGAVSTSYIVGGNTYNNIQEAIEAAAAIGNPLAVVYDDASKDTITLQGASGATRITNLADGTVAAGSKDAINGGQLHGLSTSLTTSVLGGGTVNPDGSVTGPTYNIAGGSQNNIVDAFNAVDTELTDLGNQIGGVLNDALLFDGTAYNATRAGTPTVITGVANGVVNATSTDAVNGSQLFDVQTQIDGNATDIANLTTQVGQNTTDIANLDGRVTNVEGDITNLDNRVTTVEGNVAGLTSTVNQHTSQISNLNNQVGGLTSTVNQHTSQISNLDGRVTQSTTDIANLDDRVTNVDNRVTNVEGDIVDLSQQITNIGGDAAEALETANEANAAAGEAQGTADEALSMAQDNAAFCGRGRGANSIRCGTNADVEAEASDGIAIGTDAQALAEGGIAMGSGATAVQSNSVAIGAGARAQSSVAVGTGAQATGTNTTALGDKAAASGEYAVAVGNNSVASGANSVAVGNGSVATEDNTFSVGNATQQRRITNVAPGVDPTDAVNLSQLNQYQEETNYNIYEQGRRINSVGAMGAALAMAIPDPRVKHDDQLAVGFGNYRDAQAVAATYSQLVNDNFALRIGGSYATGGETSVGAGFTIGW